MAVAMRSAVKELGLVPMRYYSQDAAMIDSWNPASPRKAASNSLLQLSSRRSEPIIGSSEPAARAGKGR